MICKIQEVCYLQHFFFQSGSFLFAAHPCSIECDVGFENVWQHTCSYGTPTCQFFLKPFWLSRMVRSGSGSSPAKTGVYLPFNELRRSDTPMDLLPSVSSWIKQRNSNTCHYRCPYEDIFSAWCSSRATLQLWRSKLNLSNPLSTHSDDNHECYRRKCVHSFNLYFISKEHWEQTVIYNDAREYTAHNKYRQYKTKNTQKRIKQLKATADWSEMVGY